MRTNGERIKNHEAEQELILWAIFLKANVYDTAIRCVKKNRAFLDQKTVQYGQGIQGCD
jgi:hypothetical protein